jgi:hypothetical protein
MGAQEHRISAPPQRCERAVATEMRFLPSGLGRCLQFSAVVHRMYRRDYFVHLGGSRERSDRSSATTFWKSPRVLQYARRFSTRGDFDPGTPRASRQCFVMTRWRVEDGFQGGTGVCPLAHVFSPLPSRPKQPVLEEEKGTVLPVTKEI